MANVIYDIVKKECGLIRKFSINNKARKEILVRRYMEILKSIVEKIPKKRRELRAKYIKLEYDKLHDFINGMFAGSIQKHLKKRPQLLNFSRLKEDAELDIKILSGVPI